MNVTGTLINYYFHCKRQCYLAGNRLNFEDNSELVKIGKSLHETKLTGKNTEVAIDQIKVDKISGPYLIEYKKSNSDLNACKWQLYYYLYVLKQKGVVKKGKLICFEKANKESKTVEIELTEDIEEQLVKICEEIACLIHAEKPPIAVYKPMCKNCAYFTYCYI